jgi:glycerate kinase
MGILSEAKDAQISEYTLTDGGDGFVDTISKAVKGSKVIRLKTIDPTGQVLTAKCALLDDDTALIGLTEASGINLVSDAEKNPLKLTNTGTGQILEKLVERGYKSIIIGVGGSATNDGGIGLLVPLGFKFLDKDGNEIQPNGEGLGLLDKVVAPDKKFNVKFTVATDVDAKLLGKNGASLCYSLAKGADEKEAQILEQNMKNLVEVAKKCGFKSAHDEAGAGAAGGCGYGLMTFLGAKRVSGFDVFAKYVGLEALIKNCNVVITGEGKFDATDTQGKGPYALAKLASKYKKPVWIFCGSSPLSQKEIDAMGIPNMKVAQILPLAPNLIEAQNRAPKFLSHLSKEFVKEIL